MSTNGGMPSKLALNKPLLVKFFSALIAAIKPIGLFVGGLYLFGFGLWGLNCYGFVDALIPTERVACFILGVTFIGWSAGSLVRFWKLLRNY